MGDSVAARMSQQDQQQPGGMIAGLDFLAQSLALVTIAIAGIWLNRLWALLAIMIVAPVLRRIVGWILLIMFVVALVPIVLVATLVGVTFVVAIRATENMMEVKDEPRPLDTASRETGEEITQEGSGTGHS